MASDTLRGKGKGRKVPKYKPESGGPKEKQPEISEERYGTTEVAKVKVLLLTFQHHGILGLDEETEDVEDAFNQLNYSVIAREIPMRQSSEALKRILTEDWGLPKPQGDKEEPTDTLYIIYYHGHGSLNTENGQFTITSHNHPDSDELCSQELPKVFDAIGDILGSDFTGFRSPSERSRMWTEARKTFGNLQPIAEIPWGDISDTIMDAPCNTLVILDCCNAGLASAMARGEEKPELNFRKELLGACSWGTETEDRMSPALCEVLRNIPDPGASSVWTVVHKMNKILVEEFKRRIKERREQLVPQAVHYILASSPADRIILKRLKIRAT